MIFYSKFASLQILVRPQLRKAIETPVGPVVEEIPAISVEFGTHGEEYRYVDPVTGNEDVAGDIRGHYLDLDAEAERQGWSEEEKELVKNSLLKICQQWPEAIRVYEPPKPEPPWRTYDEAPPERVAALAEELGLVHEAIAYEQATKARARVLKDLDKAAERLAVERAVSEAV